MLFHIDADGCLMLAYDASYFRYYAIYFIFALML